MTSIQKIRCPSSLPWHGRYFLPGTVQLGWFHSRGLVNIQWFRHGFEPEMIPTLKFQWIQPEQAPHQHHHEYLSNYQAEGIILRIELITIDFFSWYFSPYQRHLIVKLVLCTMILSWIGIKVEIPNTNISDWLFCIFMEVK